MSQIEHLTPYAAVFGAWKVRGDFPALSTEAYPGVMRSAATGRTSSKDLTFAAIAVPPPAKTTTTSKSWGVAIHERNLLNPVDMYNSTSTYQILYQACVRPS